MPLFTLADIQGEVITIIAIVGGLCFGLVCVVTEALRSAADRRQWERSRREIAAYIAEGSMSPDEGERLMNAGAPEKRGCR